MQVRSLEVSGLRSIAKASLSFDAVTVLIGGNNVGKSTFLHALRLFFEAAPKLSPDDFHKRECESIEIIVTFDNLTAGEIEEFGTAVHDDQLTITRTFSTDKESNLTYSVRARTYPGFTETRKESSKTQMRRKFNEIADQIDDQIDDLKRASNADQAIEQMKQWENAHPEDLEYSYVRDFFGAPNVANGKLKKKTSLHFIPAVVNVTEETSDAKKSPIISLLADIAKQIYENRKEVKDFIDRTQEDFDDLVAPDKFPQLAQISENLTAMVQRYYSDSRLLADWQTDEGVKFNFPQPVIKVEDCGFLSGLEHVGHGLQRAALFSVIEFLARSSVEESGEHFDEAQSDIVLLIEEPEIYQHPHKQKLVSDAFRKICSGFSSATGIRFQVVFATHSEKFIDISSFHTAKIIRKHNAEGMVQHRVSALSISECSKYFAALVEKEPMSDEAFLAKLHIFSREICEGFFAQKVILVEGVTDKAVLEGVYRSLNRDNIAEGIVVVSVDGKTKMDKPFYIFNKLSIPTYAVFDSDANSKDKKVVTNRILQCIAGVENPENFPNGCYRQFAAFESSLEGYTKTVCGDEWQETFNEVSQELGLHYSDICKTPLAVSKVIDRLRNSGISFEKFDEIVDKVDHCSAFKIAELGG